MNRSIENARVALASRTFDQGVHWRILFLGRSVNGSTDIVSCLSRSLRNLGHHVLDIDLKRHRDLSENPDRVMGGHGPIFVSLDRIEPIVRRFRPQMIVCCAGGLTFRAEDAEALKRRGIVLLGLTLSDPDVFPSIHAHAHVFDVHTTNAKVALAMYEEKGISNTVYLPFGIDRGFVTQSVSRAPQLAADVICIGHANARPERNALMQRLAGQFDVRTYGRGWEIPGSEVVEGRRMVQASREGRIHVNFPLTRAGFINVKCGVFESVGSGALLCTGRFTEMEDFFAYDSEILGYEDEEDLARKIETVLANPRLYAQMTEQAFDRLINQHLYEHRWMTLFEALPGVGRAGPEGMHEATAERIREILSTSRPRAKQVIVTGFYGASNVGDELILRSISERIEAADPAAQVWVAAENPEHVERGHALQSFSRKSHATALHAARTASAVVLGGGGLWHDYTFERAGGLLGLFESPQISIAGFAVLPLLARMLGARFHVAGLGIGPLEDPDAKRLIRFVSSHADSIMVRDAESMRLAMEICAEPERLIQAPDVVYGLSLDPVAPRAEIVTLRSQGRRIVGLNLRPWDRAGDADYVEAVASALRSIARTEPLAVIGIPMQAGERNDGAVLRRVSERLDDEVPVLLPRVSTSDDLLGLLGSLDVLVSMRLHACLLAHRLRKPVVGLAYDPKVRNHFAEIRRERYCLELPFTADALVERLMLAMQESLTVPEEASSRIAELESQAASALDALAHRLASHPSRAAVFEVPRTEMSARSAGPSAGRMGAGPVKPAAPVRARLVDSVRTVSRNLALTPATIAGARKEVSVWLPTRQPDPGDMMEVSGILELSDMDSLETSLVLRSAYNNPRAAGRIRYELQVGDACIAEDLARTAEPLHVRLFTKGTLRIPFRLGIHTGVPCFSSVAWPRASRVSISIQRVERCEHGETLNMVVSRGNVLRVTSGESISSEAVAAV